MREIWMAPTLEMAERAFKRFVTSYGAKYPQAVEKLTKDEDALLAFYDFPAEHWQHIRTTNPIEFDLCHGASSDDEHPQLRLARYVPWACIQADRGSRKKLE